MYNYGTNMRGLLIYAVAVLAAGVALIFGASLSPPGNDDLIFFIAGWTFALTAGTLAQVTDYLYRTSDSEPVAAWRFLPVTWAPTGMFCWTFILWLARSDTDQFGWSRSDICMLISLGLWVLSLLLGFLTQRRRRASKLFPEDMED
ncbi:MAG: hypothetical protein LLG01_00960 [Planctomycetaceae bacterium]|nr:hypothetical protein [Planctomycetaceae bacterium]